jgi:hypothetical protein
MNTNNKRNQTLGLLNAVADQGRGYDPDYSRKLGAYQWLRSYARDEQRLNRPLTRSDSVLANELFKDVVLALEILGITPQEVYLRLKTDGLREEVCRIERLFHE